MTLKEAYRVLRRFEDWRGGGDWRTIDEAFPKREHREAIKMILASQGLDKPIADCENCRHYAGDSRPAICKLRVVGECTKFKEVKP